jgi:hypothetical protein
MAKEYYIEIGGQRRRLQYRSRQGIELKNRFKKPLIRLLREDVMGLEPDPERPGEFKFGGTTDMEVQAAFILAGISHEAKRVTEDQVLDWVDAHIATGASMGDLVGPVWRAAFMSGVLGQSIDMDEPSKEGDGAGGKAPAQDTVKAAE